MMETQVAGAEARLITLEEGAYFLQEHLDSLDKALVTQQKQLDELHKQFNEMRDFLKIVREKLMETGHTPENSEPPHYGRLD